MPSLLQASPVPLIFLLNAWERACPGIGCLVELSFFERVDHCHIQSSV